MRKVTLGLATSVDNYIAREDGSVDWLQWNKDVAAISAKFLKTVDALLIGRQTYEAMLATKQTSYPGAKNYVFTRTKKKAARLAAQLPKQTTAQVEFVTSDAARFVRTLKNEKGKGIAVFGGGKLAKSLFAVGLIDEIVLNIHPIILGSGVPLFHRMDRQIDLQLLDSSRLKSGGVLMSYRVKHLRSENPRRF